MSQDFIDLRSDTITRPTPAMREAIANAVVGDDVMGDDPTVIELQERTAAMLGKEAAIYMASGTMTNQIAIRLHCRPGEEFLCEANCHIYNYEQSAFAQLAGVAVRPVPGDFGVLRRDDVHDLIRPHDDHQVHTRLLALENTHNRGAGRVLPYEDVADVCQWAHENGLTTHLDGARLWNASVASGISLEKWASHFDTVSVCFSKGLGAPVGSALAGPADQIREARRHRKPYGGAMRQAGIIAAGALHALEHHLDRLSEDHRHAQILVDAIRQADGLQLQPEQVDTNIVIFLVDAQLGSAADFVAQLRQQGVRMLATATDRVRAVTHLDVSEAEVHQAGQILIDVAAGQTAAPQPATPSGLAENSY